MMMVGRTVVILGWGLLLSFLHCKELGNHHLILTSTLNTLKKSRSLLGFIEEERTQGTKLEGVKCKGS